MQPGRVVAGLVGLGAIVVHALLSILLFANLGAPLLWHDEADTAMFGRRVLEYGFPKVHGPRNIVYGVQHSLDVGVREDLDAYLGSPWGQYYFAAPAVAWSDGIDALDAKTLRVRLPFVVAGAVGLGWILAAAIGTLPRRAMPRRLFALGFGIALCASVSLQLHLREARYYPLVIGLCGAVAWLESRRHLRGELPPALHTLLLSAILVLLFNTFYPVFGVILLTAAIVLAVRLLRGPGGPAAQWGNVARDALPYAIAAVAAAPMAVYYEISATTGGHFERFGESGAYAARLVDAAAYLLRFELAGPALVGVLGLAWVRRGAAVRDPCLASRLAACDVLTLFVFVYLLLVSRTPFFYERYYTPLSPALIALVGLQASALLELRGGGRRGVAVVALGVATLACLGVRYPEVGGRIEELRTPVRGPLDHVIPYLVERHPDPSGLVIATNYEDPSYMFYLGSTVTFGFYAPDLARDALLQPDVIIPRPWGVNFGHLVRLSKQAHYERREFPVANVGANNVPSLSQRNQARLVHRFRSPKAPEDGQELFILERRAP